MMLVLVHEVRATNEDSDEGARVEVYKLVVFLLAVFFFAVVVEVVLVFVFVFAVVVMVVVVEEEEIVMVAMNAVVVGSVADDCGGHYDSL
jgi:hypothetical protein